jgi:hypothetical protein
MRFFTAAQLSMRIDKTNKQVPKISYAKDRNAGFKQQNSQVLFYPSEVSVLKNTRDHDALQKQSAAQTAQAHTID